MNKYIEKCGLTGGAYSVTLHLCRRILAGAIPPYTRDQDCTLFVVQHSCGSSEGSFVAGDEVRWVVGVLFV